MRSKGKDQNSFLKLRFLKPLTYGRGVTLPRDGEGEMERLTVKKHNELLMIAKNLRHHMTSQEKRLWYDFLKNYPIKIYRQRIIDNFVADFYCYQARLVIELDGSQHYTPDGKLNDAERTEILERYGLLVMRFSNKDVEDKFEGVCSKINKTIMERIQKPSPS